MKIAFLNIYNGKIERGSEVFVTELANRLSKKHNVQVYQSGNVNKTLYKTISVSGVPFTSVFYHFWVLIFTLKCLPYLWNGRYDWLVPINGRWQVLICRLLRFFRGGRILISGHAGVGFDDRWNIIVGKPDIFIPLSPTALSWSKNIYSQEKLVYIPNGVDTDKFNPQVRPIVLSLAKPIVLTVSALLPYKQIELLIRAVNKLESVSLMVIGDGLLKQNITKLGKELLQDRFLLIPYVSHDEIAKYYTSVDLFSLPSKGSEAFGLVYLEAMACNLPVVAPDDINRREIIGEGGYLGDLINITEYTNLLKKTLNIDFGDKPRRQAEKFSWEAIATRYDEVFQKN